MKRINKNILLSLILVISILSLSACKKKEPEIPDNFGVGKEIVETSEIDTTESDKFNVLDNNIAGYEATKSIDEYIEEQSKISEEMEKKVEEIKESNKKELESIAEEREVVNKSTGKTVDISSIEDGEISNLIDKIKNSEYESLDLVFDEVDKIYNDYNDDVKNKVKSQLKDTWNYWDSKHKEIENQDKPWTEEELKENPDLASYTREEIEKMYDDVSISDISQFLIN